MEDPVVGFERRAGQADNGKHRLLAPGELLNVPAGSIGGGTDLLNRPGHAARLLDEVLRVADTLLRVELLECAGRVCHRRDQGAHLRRGLLRGSGYVRKGTDTGIGFLDRYAEVSRGRGDALHRSRELAHFDDAEPHGGDRDIRDPVDHGLALVAERLRHGDELLDGVRRSGNAGLRHARGRLDQRDLVRRLGEGGHYVVGAGDELLERDGERYGHLAELGLHPAGLLGRVGERAGKERLNLSHFRLRGHRNADGRIERVVRQGGELRRQVGEGDETVPEAIQVLPERLPLRRGRSELGSLARGVRLLGELRPGKGDRLPADFLVVFPAKYRFVEVESLLPVARPELLHRRGAILCLLGYHHLEGEHIDDVLLVLVERLDADAILAEPE